VIGSGNIFRFSRTVGGFNATNVVSIKPAGDLPGLYWGAFRPILTLAANYDRPPDGNLAASVLVTVHVGNTEVFRHRHIQRNWWRPRQLYQNADWNGGQYTNYRWQEQFFNDSTSTPTGVLIGAWTGGSNGSPQRSYQNAFFDPSAQGPANAPLAFGASTTPSTPARVHWCNAEPVWFTAAVAPGQAFELRARLFREVPNANLNPPISDTAPTSGQDAEPDETEITTSGIGGVIGGLCEGWVVRTGNANESIETIQTMENTWTIDV
jgi:hypothetical protein